jgi:hypothetical protein
VERRDLAAPDPPLESGQVRLRPFRPSVACVVAEACQDALIPWFTFMKEQLKEHEAREWIDKSIEQWARGAVRLALLAGWAFDTVGIERLTLLIHMDNAPSQHVGSRCGSTSEGVLRAYQPFKGARPDMISYSLLAADPRPWKSGAPA